MLCGGKRNGAVLEATVLENVPAGTALWEEEVFGPVVALRSYENFAEALSLVNRSKFGLQAGIFTRDLYKIQHAWDTLEVGSVIAGDVSSWRVDNMPYGGVKDSGFGHADVHFAIEDKAEIRQLVIRTP